MLIDGMTAANDLGLTDAIPAKIIVHTDARRRAIKLGNVMITFRPTALRVPLTLTMTALRPTLVQIINHIGVRMPGWLIENMRMIRRKLPMFMRHNIGIR